MSAMIGRPQDTSYHRITPWRGGALRAGGRQAMRGRPAAVPLFLWPIRTSRPLPWIGIPALRAGSFSLWGHQHEYGVHPRIVGGPGGMFGWVPCLRLRKHVFRAGDPACPRERRPGTHHGGRSPSTKLAWPAPGSTTCHAGGFKAPNSPDAATLAVSPRA